MEVAAAVSVGALAVLAAAVAAAAGPVEIFNHECEPQSKLMGIIPSASRDCSTYQFRCAALSELEFQQ